MRNPRQLLAAAAVALGLSACSSTGVEQYRNAQPALDIANGKAKYQGL